MPHPGKPESRRVLGFSMTAGQMPGTAVRRRSLDAGLTPAQEGTNSSRGLSLTPDTQLDRGMGSHPGPCEP